jgi:7-cyano-7-deazaguanine synthase
MEMDSKIMDSKVVISYSGGCDSTVLLHMAAQKYNEIHLLSFDYGQRHKRELECIDLQIDDVMKKHPGMKLIHKHQTDVRYIKDLSPTSSLTNPDIPNPDISKMAGDAQPTSYVPFRNMMFLSICCSYAESVGADTVWYGATGVDSMAGYWDADKHFIDSVNKLIGLNRKHKITIEAPLITMDKADIVRKGVELGVDFGKTWTCYSNREDGLADATTPSSSLRVKGFIDAGYKDPIKYVQQEKLEEIYKSNNCKDV